VRSNSLDDPDGAGRLWTSVDARTALLQAGLIQQEDPFDAWERSNRIAVPLSGDRLAWFPTNDEGRQGLLRERRILRLIEQHCSFRAPRILYADPTGWELRRLVPGSVRPPRLLERLQRDPPLAHRFGEELGRILADQHSSIPGAKLRGWLPRFPHWPRPEDLPHLSGTVNDAALMSRIGRALERRAAIAQDDDRSVLAHADLGLHNIAVHSDSLRVTGVFDYEGAVFGDRHQDFAYLVLHQQDEPLLEGAIAVYEPLTATRIDRDRVRLLHAVAAIGFLAYRRGHTPDEEWCGRTLEQDLAWTRIALANAGQ
jgi:aminoglycoside phosphotransferase (APT) family kinase protein